MAPPTTNGHTAKTTIMSKRQHLADWRAASNKIQTSIDVYSDLFKELVDELENQTQLNSEFKLQIEELETQSKLTAMEKRNLRVQMHDMQIQFDEAPFVLVLIDGDAALFLDHFVKGGSDGGHEAAQSLNRAVKLYLKERQIVNTSVRIVINIFFNSSGFQDTYTGAKIAESSVVKKFLLGFNRELPLTAYTDAGADKEAADSKIKATLDLFWKNPACKHILFAASADKGYVNHLRQYSADLDEQGARLTLIESVPFPVQFAELASRFLVTTFDSVFRNTKIVFGPQARVPKQSPPPPAMRKAAPVNGNGASTWANMTAAASANTGITDVNLAITRSKADNDGPWYNVKGQRIDKPLEPWDASLEKGLEQRAICQRFVFAKCPFDAAHCKFGHIKSLSKTELLVLRRIARKTKCNNGLYCEDATCPFGHQCYYGKDCAFGDDCRFDEPDMHSMDKRRAIKV